jgi:hypothetical protein
MRRSPSWLGALVSGAVVAGCTVEESGALRGVEPHSPADTTHMPDAVPSGEMLPVAKTFEPTPQQVLDYMRYLGPSLIGRVLSDAEEARLAAEGASAVKRTIDTWVLEPGFVEAVRSMLEVRLGTNGKRGEVDFNLAGYIVRHVVKHNEPWSRVVTSTTCYSEQDQPIPCDTGAPYTAGVLTTRGFLAGNEGRFNLGRARAMLLTFMCRDYPHEDTLQPYVEKARLKLMFRAENAADQKVAEVAGGFGNGLACFSCHGQFSNHAQPFVKFDNQGVWIEAATGLQSQTGQLGESDNELMASHFEKPEEAAFEGAQWFGVEIKDLAEGATAMTRSPRFHECAVQQLLDLGVGLDLGFNTGIKGLFVQQGFLASIAKPVTDVSPDPTIQQLAVAAYSDVRVMAATLNGLKR